MGLVVVAKEPTMQSQVIVVISLFSLTRNSDSPHQID
jgi:hypothetical protein